MRLTRPVIKTNIVGHDSGMSFNVRDSLIYRTPYIRSLPQCRNTKVEVVGESPAPKRCTRLL